ncbi:MAG: thiamine diphosphokinase [Deinococcaceae bacterium]
MKTAWILLGGRLTDTPCLRQTLHDHPADLVLAADGGIHHSALLGVTADIWLGDFDSSSQADLPDTLTQQFPTEKDELDGELAISAARDRGCNNLLLLGALGGRTDHMLALLLIALKMTKQGCSVILHGGDEWALPVVAGAYVVPTYAGQTLSLLALDSMETVCLDGVHWPLCGASLPAGVGLGMSNIALGQEVSLSVGCGSGFLIFQCT